MPINNVASTKRPESKSPKCSFSIYKMARVNQEEQLVVLDLVFNIRGENLVLKSPHELIGLFRQAQS
jgi:hypothetical protein